jgi:hypothetical protein
MEGVTDVSDNIFKLLKKSFKNSLDIVNSCRVYKIHRTQQFKSGKDDILYNTLMLTRGFRSLETLNRSFNILDSWYILNMGLSNLFERRVKIDEFKERAV